MEVFIVKSIILQIASNVYCIKSNFLRISSNGIIDFRMQWRCLCLQTASIIKLQFGQIRTTLWNSIILLKINIFGHNFSQSHKKTLGMSKQHDKNDICKRIPVILKSPWIFYEDRILCSVAQTQYCTRRIKKRYLSRKTKVHALFEIFSTVYFIIQNYQRIRYRWNECEIKALIMKLLGMDFNRSYPVILQISIVFAKTVLFRSELIPKSSIIRAQTKMQKQKKKKLNPKCRRRYQLNSYMQPYPIVTSSNCDHWLKLKLTVKILIAKCD